MTPCSDNGLGVLQHESLALLKELLFALDLALYVGTPGDKKAADRLQRRSTPLPFPLNTADREQHSHLNSTKHASPMLVYMQSHTVKKLSCCLLMSSGISAARSNLQSCLGSKKHCRVCLKG